MKSLPLLVILVATILSSCATEIRVRNDSHLDFKDVVVGNKNYGDIQHGQVTGYQRWDHAYRYAFVSLFAASKPYRLQPIDFVGEEYLGRGKFTYVLTFRKGELDILAEKDTK